MKNAIYAATVLLVLAASTAPAMTLQSNGVSDKTTTQPTQPSPSTDQVGPPQCPMHDPNGCGIYD